MEISICGARKVSFKNDNGDQISGTTYYYLFQDYNVDGYAPDKLFIPDGASYYNPFEVGKSYEVQYNRRGRIDIPSVKLVNK